MIRIRKLCPVDLHLTESLLLQILIDKLLDIRIFFCGASKRIALAKCMAPSFFISPTNDRFLFLQEIPIGVLGNPRAFTDFRGCVGTRRTVTDEGGRHTHQFAVLVNAWSSLLLE